MTTYEIARELGISRQQVDNILNAALRKLKRNVHLMELWEQSR